MYKSYIETKHENRDRLGPSEMGKAGYLLTRPRTKHIVVRSNFSFFHNILFCNRLLVFHV